MVFVMIIADKKPLQVTFCVPHQDCHCTLNISIL